MNKKILTLVAVPLLGLGLIGANYASAHGFGFGMFGGFGASATPQQIATQQTAKFQAEADVLGISVDDVKNAWAKGETLQQLATEHNITAAQLQQKMSDYRTQHIKTQIQGLVDQGVITQAQADARLQFIQNNQGSGGMMGGRMGRGFHMGL